MEQGLRILIQLVLEFAPIIAVFVQKRHEAVSAIVKDKSMKEVQEFIQGVTDLIVTPDSSREFEQDKLLQQQLAVYQRQTQFKLAEQEREIALKLPEIHKILDSWPLRLYPSQILDPYLDQKRKPLKIFIAPPQVQFDRFTTNQEGIGEVELKLSEGLRQFLTQHYSLHCQVRPTEFLAGAWDSKRFHSESSIKALFEMLKSEPTLILESEVDGDYLNLRIAYWGLGQKHYYYKTISRVPYQEIIYGCAKARALDWKKIRDQLLLLGEDLDEINKFGGNNINNLALLEKVENWQSQGIDLSRLPIHYQVDRQDWEKLCQFLISGHCLVAGWMADAYHLVHYNVPPLLPELLPDLLKDTPDFQAVQAIATGYKQIYEALEDERRYWIPEIALELAQSLAHLPDRSWAQEQVDYSVNTWLQLRRIQIQGNEPLEAMQLALSVEDEEYFQHLRAYFTAIGDPQSVAQVEKHLSAIANLKLKRRLEYATCCHCLTKHSDRITSVAINPDGQTLVSSSTDKTIKIWDITTGQLIRTLNGHSGEVSSISVSPDGQLLAIGSYDHPKSNVKVWHLHTGELIHTLLGHHKPVNCIAISPDGKILASGSNKIKIWHLQKGDRLCTLWHSSAVNSVAISPDSAILASASSDNKIRLWNPLTGELLRSLVEHTAAVTAVAISADGQILISGSADSTIKIWHLGTHKLLYTLIGHAAEVTAVAISGDGQTLISGSADSTIKIWQVSTAKLLHTLNEHTGAVNAVAISPDNQLLVSGSADQTIRIWRIL